MSFLRPEVAALIRRWREVEIAAAVALAGLWLATRGGSFLALVGGGVVALGAALAVIGLRRLRFSRETAGPGIVRVVEGQMAYLGPFGGGFVGMPDLAELALIRDGEGRRFWRMASIAGAPVLVPVSAIGAEALFDIFAALPGLDMAELLAALDAGGQGDRVIWRRPVRLQR